MTPHARTRTGWLLGLLLTSTAQTGCESRPSKPSAPLAASDARPTRRSGKTIYPLKGVVRKVDRATGEVVIAHEAMPGFMDAMTMPFTLADRQSLADVRPGDEVEGPFEVEFDSEGRVKASRLVDLTVSNPVPEGAISSDTGAAVGDAPVVLKPGELVPNFVMTCDDGSTLSLERLRGNVVVLTFIYTRCPLPDFCPAVDTKFKEMARRLGAIPGRADRVRLLSVSFDPEHDDPATLRAHAARWGAVAPLWRFVVAPHDELRKVAAPLGLSYGAAGREIVHNLCTAVIDSEGRLARLEVGSQGRKWSPDDLLATVRALTPPGVSP